MNGGGAQGGLPGIIEYLSQTNDCADFLKSDEKYRYIDDLSILEIINLISVGISSYNCKSQIPNDMKVGNTYILDPGFFSSRTEVNRKFNSRN